MKKIKAIILILVLMVSCCAFGCAKKLPAMYCIVKDNLGNEYRLASINDDINIEYDPSIEELIFTYALYNAETDELIQAESECRSEKLLMQNSFSQRFNIIYNSENVNIFYPVVSIQVTDMVAPTMVFKSDTALSVSQTEIVYEYNNGEHYPDFSLEHNGRNINEPMGQKHDSVVPFFHYTVAQSEIPIKRGIYTLTYEKSQYINNNYNVKFLPTVGSIKVKIVSSLPPLVFGRTYTATIPARSTVYVPINVTENGVYNFDMHITDGEDNIGYGVHGHYTNSIAVPNSSTMYKQGFLTEYNEYDLEIYNSSDTPSKISYVVTKL